jgi:hypothetical protein
VGSEGTAAGRIAPDAGPAVGATAGEHLLVAAAALVVERAAAHAVVTLRNAGIRTILLKGSPQQDWLAAAGAPRASIDVDLLVDPTDAATAGRTLSEVGYRLVPQVTPGVGQHASVWSATGQVTVDVHDRLWGAEGDTWHVLVRNTESVALAGADVEVPSEAARCLVVALHAAHHGAGKPATLYDLERAVAVARRSTWTRATELARAMDAEIAFAAGLDLVPTGKRLRRELGLEKPALNRALALDIATPSAGAAGFYWLSQQHGVRARTRFVLRKLVPPADFMRYKHPSARRGRGHLLLVYVYRPFWLARWAIPGLLEWRRIRATARTDDRTSE